MAAVSYPTAIPTLTIGGRVFTDLENLKVLSAYCDCSAGTRYSTLRLHSASAGYQVPVGKTFKVLAVAVIPLVGAAASRYAYPVYGDNDVGFASAAAPTNAVFPYGNQTASVILPSNTVPTAANTRLEMAIRQDIPAGKYPAVLGTLGLEFTAYVFGYEV